MEPSSLQTQLQVTVFILFVAYAVYAMHRNHQLYQRMQKVAPKYYEKIGKPTVYSNNMKRQFKGAVDSWRMAFKLPKGFPQDAELRERADRDRLLRWVGFMIWALWVLLITRPDLV
jgi:hypothetical protein